MPSMVMAAHNHDGGEPSAKPAVALVAPVVSHPVPDVLWFSDSPPFQKKAAAAAPAPEPGAQGAQSVEAAVVDLGERAQNSTNNKRLWLRTGADPARAAAMGVATIASTIRVLGADGESWTVAPVSDGGRYLAEIPIAMMGFYNAYLTQAALTGDRLEAQVAKAEVLKGTCCKKGVDPEQEKAISDPTQPMELVRDHMPDEKLFTRLVSGDKINFTVTSFGKPLAGAKVTFCSQQGWSKTVTSDDQGRVQFTLIRDYFPGWDDFKRLTKQTFLITAEAQTDTPGMWNGQEYRSAHLRTTLSGKYSPSPYDYRSYAFGLGISGGIALFLGTAIYLYRRRRVKPFQEIRFNEQA
ncbi:hypothetical protein CCC_04204 [Paramagnetospirillum magnetotacticum MS-1]|uniref:Uncharacterized protein n=2 Tax=Paramagnetospirillum magnetotacticum TaxID=188 RepID=A0A0C2YWD1_PARME|nr:hypothetical protein CCC_04204 [Paramagnetospirillum magnetotacticum MS-1]